jgi:hypothetical protein
MGSGRGRILGREAQDRGPEEQKKTAQRPETEKLHDFTVPEGRGFFNARDGLVSEGGHL